MQWHGIYWILDVTPVWMLVLALEFATVDALWLARRIFEGWPYNNSLSSEIGDRRLITAGAGIAATIVQHYHSAPPPWLATPTYQWLVVVAAIATAVAICARNRDATLADAYHNAVIVPVLIILVSMSIPVIAACGSNLERGSALICVMAWALLVRYDHRHGRLKQLEWLRDHGLGVHLKGGHVNVDCEKLTEDGQYRR